MSEEWAYFIPGYATHWANIKDDPIRFEKVNPAIHSEARALAELQGYRLLAFTGDAVLPAPPAYRDGDGVRWTWDAEKVTDEG